MDARADAYPTGSDALDLDLSLDEIIARRKNRWPGLPSSSSSYPTELPNLRQPQTSVPPVHRFTAGSDRIPGGGTHTEQRRKRRGKADTKREKRKRKRTAQTADRPVPTPVHRHQLPKPKRELPPHMNRIYPSPTTNISPSSLGIISEIDQASHVFHTLPPDQKGNITVKNVYIGPFPAGIKVGEVRAMMELCVGPVVLARAVQSGKGGGLWIKVDFAGGKGWKAYKKSNGAFLDTSIRLEVIPVILG